MMDSDKLIDTECSSFATEPSLRNLVNGMVAAEDVHEYERVSNGIISGMEGESAVLHSFKRFY